MNTKKIISLMLTVMLFVPGVSYVLAEDTNMPVDEINIEERIAKAQAAGHRYAYVKPGDSKVEIINGTIRTNRWNIADGGTSASLYSFDADDYQGKRVLQPTSVDIQSNVFINLEGEYWEPEPEKRMAITVEYIDVEKASLGVFTSTNYHGRQSPTSVEHEPIFTQGTGEWKTVTYYIDDYASSSIRLRTPAIQPMSGVPNRVPIGRIFIEEGLGEHPLSIDAEGEYPGRILSFGRSDSLNGIFESTLNTRIDADIKYDVKDYEGRCVYSGELPHISLEAYGTVAVTVPTGVTLRGTYTMDCNCNAAIQGGETVVFTKSLKFSILDTRAEGDELNPLVGVCDSTNDFYGGGYKGAAQIAMLPISGVRLGGMEGTSVEVSDGSYTDPILNDRKYYSDNGAEVYVIAYKMPSWHNGNRADNVYPNTDEAHNAYAAYAAYIAKQPYVDTIELFNEWNHSGFSPADQSADGYLEYCKAAYPAIKAAAKEAGKDIHVLAGGTAGFAANWLERFIRLGGLNYCDGLSYHPYQYRSFNYKSFKEQTDTVTGWMLEYYGSVKPITLTEMGIPEARDQETTNSGYEHWNKTRSVPGMYIMAQHSGAYNKIYYYCMHSTGMSPEQREPGFGLFEFVGNTDGNRLAAKDSAVSFAAYMDKLTGAEPGRKIEANDFETFAYEFRKKDGTNIAALWTASQHDRLGVDLGADEIEVYDQFGNYRDTLYSSDGRYSFDITDEIIYIEGSFEKFEQCDDYISLSDGVISGLVGDLIEFTVADAKNRNLRCELDFDSDVFAFDGVDFKDGKVNCRAQLKEGVTGRYHVSVKLIDESGRTVYFARPAVAITTEALNVRINTAQFSNNNDRRWVVNVYLTNISATKILYGQVTVTEPDEYAGSGRSFAELMPGEERLIKINLPEMVVKRPQQLTVKIRLTNGTEKIITQKLDFTSANKAVKKPVIDGKIDKDEWTSTLLAEDRPSRYVTLISGTRWNGMDDLSVKHKIMWDEDNFYMMAMVSDNVHFTSQTDPSMMWQDDSVQFGILMNKEETLDSGSLAFTEMCISANRAGDIIYRHTSASGKALGVVDNCEVKIGRNGGYTIYEMRIPWTELLADAHTAKADDEYAFSFLVNDNDGGGRKGYMFYNDGIGGSKLPSLFGRLHLN